MRCTNCGWENPEGAQNCEKCKSPLKSVNEFEPVREASQEPNQILKGTISEANVFPGVNNPEPQGMTCPKCGFPLRNGSGSCPQCGYDLNNSSSNHVNQQVESKTSKPNRNATVNPWANPVATNGFTLCPVAWDNERNCPGEQNFSGEYHELNRENTDPGNNTITSKIQAEISYEDGNWVLSDKSAQKTTFVYAGRKITLQDGDIIMLGNRRFVFKTE